MEAMRAVTKSRSLVKVVVVKLSSLNGETLASWADNSVRRGTKKITFPKIGHSNSKRIHYFGVAINHVLSKGHLDAGKYVVSCLEVDELNSTDTLRNSSITSVFIASEAIEE